MSEVWWSSDRWDPACALPVVVAVAVGAWFCGRRAVWSLGRQGHLLAPAWLTLAGLCGVSLGMRAGSLRAMAWGGALAIVVVSTSGLRGGRRRRPSRRSWAGSDVLVLGACAAAFLAINGNDTLCHESIVAAYLRGNVPPTAFNDPSYPLVYHHLFDGVAALVAAAFGLDTEAALDVTSIAFVALVLDGLIPISKQLFRDATVRRSARALFILGFGLPAQGLGALLAGRVWLWPTAQPFLGAVFRRPQGLDYLLFVFLVAALLPRLTEGYRALGPGPLRTAPVAGYLLPAALLLPQSSEALTTYALLALVGLAVARRFAAGSLAAWLAFTVIGMALAGTWRVLFDSAVPMAYPKWTLGWPPALPNWTAPSGAVPWDSVAALRTVALELGPVFLLGTLAAACSRDRRQQALAGFVLFGWLAASFSRLDGWVASDTDRLAFFSTSTGFLLGANVVSRGLAIVRRRGWPGAIGRTFVAGVLAASLATTVAVHVFWATTPSRWLWKRAGGESMEVRSLITALAQVGPREQVLTHPALAGILVRNGFVVAAPLASSALGRVEEEAWDDYLRATPELRPAWLLLADGSNLVEGRDVLRRIGPLVLTRAPTGATPLDLRSRAAIEAPPGALTHLR